MNLMMTASAAGHGCLQPFSIDSADLCHPVARAGDVHTPSFFTGHLIRQVSEPRKIIGTRAGLLLGIAAAGVVALVWNIGICQFRACPDPAGALAGTSDSSDRNGAIVTDCYRPPEERNKVQAVNDFMRIRHRSPIVILLHPDKLLHDTVGWETRFRWSVISR